MRAFNQSNIIPASTVMNTTINSTPVQLYNVLCYAIQVVFTGTPTGSFKLQASNDPAALATQQGSVTQTQSKPNNWTDIASSSTTVSAAGDILWTVDSPAYNWVRVVYTDSSGGTATSIVTVATANGKGF